MAKKQSNTTLNTEHNFVAEQEQIDSTFAAYKLLEILFEEGLINFATYQKIQAERKAYLETLNTENQKSTKGGQDGL